MQGKRLPTLGGCGQCFHFSEEPLESSINRFGGGKSDVKRLPEGYCAPPFPLSPSLGEVVEKTEPQSGTSAHF